MDWILLPLMGKSMGGVGRQLFHIKKSRPITGRDSLAIPPITAYRHMRSL